MRYLGGKKRQAKSLVTCMRDSSNSQTWIEPFLGGANMTIIACKYFNELIINDHDPYVYTLWHAGIFQGWEPPPTPNQEEYTYYKNNKVVNPTSSFLCFAASFNGKKWGGYGPISSGRNYYDESRRAYLNDVEILSEYTSNIRLSNVDYADMPTNGLVYCDPPYANTTKYGTDEWNPSRFWSWANSVNEIYVSEYSAPADWKSIWEKERKATCDPTKTKSNMEKLFTK